jgi:hypothetical protein
MARLDGCVAFLFWRVLARVLGVARALMSLNVAPQA